MENIFELTTEKLKTIANHLQERIEEGLKDDGMEIAAIPTYITSSEEITDGKVLALDWGGTNFRAAVVEFKDGNPKILETEKILLSAQTLKDNKIETQDALFAAMTNVICKLKTLDENVKSIGYCFSYPAKCEIKGDATLLCWAKEINIPDMVGKLVGEPLREYLNKHLNTKFKHIKVINDTVACLFAGLSKTGYQNYIGLIVGTGTNMASLMRRNKIEKLNSKENDYIPVNLESGNFNPPYLIKVDDLVDETTNNKGVHRFEKAISGGYLGKIFVKNFLPEKTDYDFDCEMLSELIKDSEKQIQTAKNIAERSANLVAASIAGLVQVLVKQDNSVKKIGLAADGSVFWKTPNYIKMVEDALAELLPIDVKVEVLPEMQDPNIIGSAIAALSAASETVPSE